MGQRWYLGIDPGVTGAFALLSEDSTIYCLADMPTKRRADGDGKEYDIPELTKLFQDLKNSMQGSPCIASIEQAQMRSVEARQVTAKVWYGYGVLAMGMAMLCPENILYIRPQEWKYALDVSTPRGLPRAQIYKALKSLSLEKAHSLWPGAVPMIRRNHNRAEALLIAEYGRRKTLICGDPSIATAAPPQ